MVGTDPVLESTNVRYGPQLLREAKTLRECVLARLISQVRREEGGTRRVSHYALAAGAHTFVLPPGELTLRALLDDIASSEYRDLFSAIPFAKRVYADPELRECLQDLAEIIAYEATEAFRASFYPGVVDVEPLTEEHIVAVMQALQREMDREAKRRGKVPVRYLDLPPDRQRALAERRRWWYGKFGITPQSWVKGTFSLWDVAEEPPPEWLTF